MYFFIFFDRKLHDQALRLQERGAGLFLPSINPKSMQEWANLQKKNPSRRRQFAPSRLLVSPPPIIQKRIVAKNRKLVKKWCGIVNSSGLAQELLSDAANSIG